MSDNPFGLNCSKEDASELTRLLLGSVQRLLDLKQYNAFIKLQAIADPFKFIAEVETHAATLEQEDESKGNFHIRITGSTVEGQREKIPPIKALRVIMGWGLADSKYSFEALPGSGAGSSKPDFTIVSKAFTTRESLEWSSEWEALRAASRYFTYEIIRLPVGTPQSLPYTP